MSYRKYGLGMINSVLFLLAISVSLATSAGPLSEEDPVTSTGTVYRAVDGDTFIVNLADPAAYERIVRQAGSDVDRLSYLDDRFQSIRVRLGNVDTPESSHSDPSRNTPEGIEAAAIVAEITEGQEVQVACYDWGHYGRSICNLAVAHNGGWADLGGWLIMHGISPYVTSFGNNPFFHEQYRALEAKAPAWP